MKSRHVAALVGSTVTVEEPIVYNTNWALEQLNKITATAKEFVAQARGKVFMQLKENNSYKDYLKSLNELGFKETQANSYIDYASKAGIVAIITANDDIRLSVAIVNALPNNTDNAQIILDEAKEMAAAVGSQVTAKTVEGAKEKLGIVDTTTITPIQKQMERAALQREYLLGECGYTAERLLTEVSVKKHKQNKAKDDFVKAIEGNQPRFNTFYEDCKSALTGESLQLLEELNQAAGLFYEYQASQEAFDKLEGCKGEFSKKFNKGEI